MTSSFKQNLVYPQIQDLEVLGVLNNRQQEILKILDQYQARHDRVCNPSNQFILSKLCKTSYKESSLGKIVGLKSVTHLGSILRALEKNTCIIHRKTVNLMQGDQIRGARTIYLVKISEWIEQNKWLDDLENCQKIQRKKSFIQRNLNTEQQKYLQDQLKKAKGEKPDTSGHSNMTADDVFEQNKKVDVLVKQLGEHPSYEDKRLFVKDLIDQRLVMSHLSVFSNGELKERLVKKVWSRLAHIFLAIGAERKNLPSLYRLYLYRLWGEDNKIHNTLEVLYLGMSKKNKYQVKNSWAYFLYHLNLSVGKAPKKASIQDLINKFKQISVMPCNNRQECLQKNALESSQKHVNERTTKQTIETEKKVIQERLCRQDEKVEKKPKVLEVQKELENQTKAIQEIHSQNERTRNKPKILEVQKEFWAQVLENESYGKIIQQQTAVVLFQDGEVSFHFKNKLTASTIEELFKHKVLKALERHFPYQSFNLERILFLS